ncbi:MAG: hypothetical protein DWQ06_16565 [Calditrichaeota bacterium]|nr:MAG: hypothetical protein DWQ06_16565 [Calditrichota bacterium]
MTTNKKQNDGGYYAIKGFEHQFNKTILEILSAEDENMKINFEQIQDLDSTDFVMQIKYKETQKYTPSKIKIPILQLINEFQEKPDKTYILYCYFKDKEEGEEKLDIDELNTILGVKKDSLEESIKSKFLKNFKLLFSSEFNQQLNKVIENICSLIDCNEEEAILHHSLVTQYLTDLITQNPKTKIENRVCSKKEIRDLIQKGQKIIFKSSFRRYKGEKQYFQKIKKEYFSKLNLDKFATFIIVELKGNEKQSEIKNIVSKVKNRFYRKQRIEIKGEAPYIFFKNLDSSKLIELKKELLQEKEYFKDGYDFEGADFNVETIKIKATKNNLIVLKFVNREDILKILLSEKFSTKKEIYQFYITKPISVKDEITNVSIQIEEIDDINKIL